MRILFVQPTGDRKGHFPEYTAKLCRALAKAGHDVVLCTNRINAESYIGTPLPFRIYLAAGGRLACNDLATAGKSFSLRYTSSYVTTCYRVVDDAFRLAAQEPFDLVHVTGAEFGTLSLLTRLHRRTIPPVVTEISAVNFSFNTYPGSLPIRLYKELQRRLLRRALGREVRGIAVLGEFHRDGLQQQLRLPQNLEVLVMHDGGEDPQEPLDRESARRRLNLPADGDLFLFFGLIRLDKGLPILLDAVSRVKTKRFRLLIAGYPSDIPEQEILAAIQAYGLQDRVIPHLRYIADEDVADYFYACDALVLPYTRSYTGGSGPFLRGACAHGRPTIVSDVSEMGLLARKHGVGLVATPEAPDDLARQIQNFLELPPQERDAMAQRGLELARANGWSSMAQKLTRMYEAILRRPSPAAQIIAAE